MEEEILKRRIYMGKKKILAILPNNQELQGNLYTANLYSSNRDGQKWLYSGLEGLLALIIDYNVKTKYICLYDPMTYQKCFQYELYNNFENYFYTLAPEFLCFEIDSGFIGLHFEKEADAAYFERVIKKITSMKNELFHKPSTKEDQKLQKEIVSNYVKKIKDLFSDGESKFDENYLEDGTKISKYDNFQILKNISYDKNTKQFKIGKISNELKYMFLSLGINKRDLESDMDFVFTLFKKVIIGLGAEKKLKYLALETIEHNFPHPEELDKLRRNEEEAESKFNSKRLTIKKKKHPPKSNPPKGKPMEEKKGLSIPSSTSAPPPPPKLLPNPVPKVNNPINNPKITTVAKPEVDVATQIKNLKLKPVVKEENKEKNKLDNKKNILQEALSKAIILRHDYIHMHDDDDEEEDDDW